jgi:tagaturonate reductase
MKPSVKFVEPLISSKTTSELPIKVLQFGTGNFLRGFADWIIQRTNQSGLFAGNVCVVQSISNDTALERQQGAYHIRQSGIRDEEYTTLVERVDVIKRIIRVNQQFEKFLEEALNPDLEFIISNTTETGIQFVEEPLQETAAKNFPGKLTQFLFHRFKNKVDKQLIILPCELIEQNGVQLKICVQRYAMHWSLGEGFLDWLDTYPVFCNTLVDRIVTAAPQQSNGLQDELFLETELFHLWAIECPATLESKIPFSQAGLNVILTRDISIYRNRKVRILNGAHTAMACAGYLAGIATVREVMAHPVLSRFVRRLVFDEVLPTLVDNQDELESYANEVFNRFKNPAIQHNLINITLSSFAKFNIRLLPSIDKFFSTHGSVPERIAFSLAATIFFYRGLRNGKTIPLKDTDQTIEYMKTRWAEASYSEAGMLALVRSLFAEMSELKTLQSYAAMDERVAHHLYIIDQVGIVDALKAMQEQEHL